MNALNVTRMLNRISQLNSKLYLCMITFSNLKSTLKQLTIIFMLIHQRLARLTCAPPKINAAKTRKKILN